MRQDGPGSFSSDTPDKDGAYSPGKRGRDLYIVSSLPSPFDRSQGQKVIQVIQICRS